jgi:hypothetical protein
MNMMAMVVDNLLNLERKGPALGVLCLAERVSVVSLFSLRSMNCFKERRHDYYPSSLGFDFEGHQNSRGLTTMFLYDITHRQNWHDTRSNHDKEMKSIKCFLIDLHSCTMTR